MNRLSMNLKTKFHSLENSTSIFLDNNSKQDSRKI